MGRLHSARSEGHGHRAAHLILAKLEPRFWVELVGQRFLDQGPTKTFANCPRDEDPCSSRLSHAPGETTGYVSRSGSLARILMLRQQPSRSAAVPIICRISGHPPPAGKHAPA